MKLIESKAELIHQLPGINGIYRQIELAGRTCYKSEDKITETSSKNFVERMINSKHTAMLEHGTVYLHLQINPSNAFKKFEYPLAMFTAPYNWSNVVDNLAARYRTNKYSYVISRCSGSNRDIYVTTNYRVIIENGWKDDLQFICAPTTHHPGRYTIRFTTDRGISHELVRHRSFSFAQESQRYCNYSKVKFNSEIQFLLPSGTSQFAYHLPMTKVYEQAEKTYLDLIKRGCPPQEARAVLPNATKTEIVMTGFTIDWIDFFNLRWKGTTGKPHPDMAILAKKALEEFEKANVKEIIDII